jgi:putative endonuclease
LRDKRETGKLGEDLACGALLERGYEVVARGWRCRQGEVDIIARDGECWVFAEVKTRRGTQSGLPEEGLTRRKAERLVALAETYLAERELANVNWRIDLVAIELDPRDQVRRLNLVRGVLLD